MSNQKYISIKSDFLEKTELQLDYQYDYGMKEVEGYLTTKYKVGDYAVGKADQYGQRITIDITIGRGTNTTIVKSGWMINPDKSIRLITPFAGFGE